MYSLYSHLACIDQDSWSSRVQHALPFYFQKAGPALQLLASPAFEVMLKPKSAIFAVPCLGLKKKNTTELTLETWNTERSTGYIVDIESG